MKQLLTDRAQDWVDRLVTFADFASLACIFAALLQHVSVLDSFAMTSAFYMLWHAIRGRRSTA